LATSRGARGRGRLLGGVEAAHATEAVVRILIALAVVAAILVVVFATGWADDKARPGTRGRAPVSTPVTTPTP
jgi:hypothetical protein